MPYPCQSTEQKLGDYPLLNSLEKDYTNFHVSQVCNEFQSIYQGLGIIKVYLNSYCFASRFIPRKTKINQVD